MSLRSMTGFARVRRTFGQGELTVSLKSVNHRGLDLQLRLPPDLDPVEHHVRGVLKTGIARGHVQLQVTLERAGAASGSLNRPLFDVYLKAFREAAEAGGFSGQQPDLNSFLGFPGMLAANEAGEDAGEEVVAALLAAVAEAVAVLNAFREREGAATGQEIGRRSREVLSLVERMEAIRAGAVAAFQKRLGERLAELLRGAALEPDRLAQEAAILADRSDISEELMRLRTHAAQLETILSGDAEAGKRLEFLLQEMNREANTILAKTGGLGDLGLTMTDLALAARTEIDKIREQSLNLE
jgi:uncharacterized protein (TIGR00255 family)